MRYCLYRTRFVGNTYHADDHAADYKVTWWHSDGDTSHDYWCREHLESDMGNGTFSDCHAYEIENMYGGKVKL